MTITLRKWGFPKLEPRKIPKVQPRRLDPAGWRKILLAGDPIASVFSARHITSEVSTTSTTYATIVDSDVIINAPLFRVDNKLFLKFFAHLKNDTAGETTYARLYRQHAGTVIDGTEVSVTDTAYQIAESDWVDISNETGPESYQVQMKVTAATGYCNSAIMLLSYVQL